MGKYENSKISSVWFDYYTELSNFYIENGHSNVRGKYISVNKFKLGYWVQYQRKCKNKLNDFQISLLKQLDFKWDGREAQWQYSYHQLVKHFNAFNNIKIERKFVDVDGFELGKWVTAQAVNFKKLSPDKQQKLLSLGITVGKYDRMFENGISHLKDFKKENLHLNVPNNYITADGFKLGLWCHSKKYRWNKLNEEQRSRLLEIGFIGKSS